MSNPFLFRKKNLRPSPLNSNEFKHSFRSLSQFLVEIIITLRYGQLETCRNVIYVLLLYLYRETKQTEKRISISRVSSSPLLLLLLLLSPYTNILVVILFSCRRFHLRFISFFFFRAPGRLCRFEEKWRDIRNFRHINDARLILKRKYIYSISSDHFWSAEGKENHLIKKRDSCIDVDVSSSRRRAM